MERRVELYSGVETDTHGNYEHGLLTCAATLVEVCFSAPSPVKIGNGRKISIHDED
jgi:hypothetical protein